MNLRASNNSDGVVRSLSTRIVHAVFADRLGVTIFVASILFFMLYWRIGFFINDNWTIANTLANVAQGQLHISDVVYGTDSGNHPGMHIVDGKLYGRNYGIAFLALPILWILDGLSVVVPISITISALWSFGILWIGVEIGRRWVSAEIARWSSGFVALGLFLLNVLFAQPIDPRWHPIMALQILTMVSAGLLAVFLYRILARIHDRRTGLVMALVLVFGTSVGFWASIPKRHVIIAALAMLSFYGFIRSRQSDEPLHLGFRALSYAAVGISAWVFPAEAIVLFVVLAPLDIATAPSNTSRELVVVGGIFAISLLPAFLTNYLVVGNPLEPPKMWPDFHGQVDVFGSSEQPANAGNPEPSSNPKPSPEPAGNLEPPKETDHQRSLLTAIIASISAFVSKGFAAASYGVSRLAQYMEIGLDVSANEPGKLYRVFIRSGWLNLSGERGINLSILETAPVLGALFALPIAAFTRARHRARTVFDHLRPSDVFAISYSVILALLYLHRLPLYATITIRYLLPVIPFAVYGVGRVSMIRSVLRENIVPGLWTYAGIVMIGTQLWVLWLILANPIQSEAMQLHAILGFAAGGSLAVWTGLQRGMSRQLTLGLGSILVGIAAGVTTVFVLQTGLVYAHYGEFALGFVNAIVDRLAELVVSVVTKSM